MSLLFFTDASYSPQLKIGVIATIEVENGVEKEIVITEHNMIKNSELEKMGIERCIKLADGRNATIYTDCESALKGKIHDNISFVWIKGHKSLENRKTETDILFRKVDLIARRRLRELVAIAR